MKKQNNSPSASTDTDIYLVDTFGETKLWPKISATAL